jgi:hypothetical protein
MSDKIKEYKKKAIPKALKRSVWDKHIGEEIGKAKCLCCNLTEITQMSFHCGHIVAEVNGGETNIDNLLPVCELCNKSMGTTNLIEFRKKLQSEKKDDVIVINEKSMTVTNEKSMTVTNEKSMTVTNEKSRIITGEQKYKLRLLLEKTKKCNRLYFLRGTDQENANYKKWGLIATGGDDTPYRLIYDTYNSFYSITTNSLSKTYTHKKCGNVFLIDLSNKSIEYDQKIKNFVNHIDCLFSDNEYIFFCYNKKYI